MQRMDRLMKAFCLLFTLYLCNSLTLGSGSVFNPAHAFAQSMYMIGIYNSNGSGLGAQYGKVVWVYILVPFVASAVAALFYLLHQKIDNASEKQTEPMQFVESNEGNDEK